MNSLHSDEEDSAIFITQKTTTKEGKYETFLCSNLALSSFLAAGSEK
jgi:hypothetical protein